MDIIGLVLNIQSSLKFHYLSNLYCVIGKVFRHMREFKLYQILQGLMFR